MTHFRKTARFTALALLALALGFPAQAPRAAQGSVCLPTTGQYSGLTAIVSINAGFAALLSSNAGPSAPANDCSGAPVVGQVWLDTSAQPYAYNMWDGAQWKPMGFLDATTHEWRLPPATSQFKAVDGTLSAPGLSFGNEAGTGLRRAASGDLRLTVQGTDIAQITTAGFNLLTGVINAVPTGTVVDFAGLTPPAGWFFADGACYSRTEYATLYGLIGLTYGTGCGPDGFPVPDLRGRVVAGLDNMGGTAAGRLTSPLMSPNGTTRGATGGQQTRVLSVAELPPHTHPNTISVSATTQNAGAHDHGGATGSSSASHNHGLSAIGSTNISQGTGPVQSVLYPTGGVGQGFVSDSASASHSHGISSGGDHSHVVNVSSSITNASTGSGSAFGLVQPTLALNKIIKF